VPGKLMSAVPLAYTSRFFSAADGLQLHVRDYGPRDGAAIPIVCLAGLTRSSGDFDPLATALATGGGAGGPRRVLALDYRGRGRSEYDPNWHNYSLEIENADILTVLDAAGIERAIFVGTSRGGLHAMGLSASRPMVIVGAVLNDIGPVLDPAGIARIRSYLGTTPVPRSLDEAVAILKRIMADRFTALSEADWKACAEATFLDHNGRLGILYDENLAKSFMSNTDLTPLPTFWPLFEGLRGRPVLVVRGANSDLLAPETVAEMVSRHDNCEVHVAEGQGHAPLLNDAPTIRRICSFVTRAEAAAGARGA
jgi:pimeloyl-ACP methyl ester carboxylesterase